MQVDQDLAALLRRNLTFDPNVQTELGMAQIIDAEIEAAPEIELPKSDPKPITYSVSQHYHHSAHVCRPKAAEPKHGQPRSLSEPPLSGNPSSEQILARHGIDLSVLSPSQLQLFRVADQSHQMRLIELWTTCPPESQAANASMAWNTTTLDQEAQFARERWEQQQQQQQQQHELGQQRTSGMIMSLDGTTIQADDGRWLSLAEPYMAAGYMDRHDLSCRPRDAYSHFGTGIDGLSCVPATDPVLAGPDQQRHAQMNGQFGGMFGPDRGMRMIDAMDVS